MPTSNYRHLLLLPLALLMAGLGFLAFQNPNPRKPRDNDTPEACINRMLKAQDSGDSQAYLDCFSPEERTTIHARWKDKPANQIAADLRRQNTGLVGRAITDVQLLDANHAELAIERIHKDHVARQKVTTELDRGEWQITSLATPDRIEPAIPYGTPVFTPAQ